MFPFGIVFDSSKRLSEPGRHDRSASRRRPGTSDGLASSLRSGVELSMTSCRLPLACLCTESGCRHTTRTSADLDMACSSRWQSWSCWLHALFGSGSS